MRIGLILVRIWLLVHNGTVVAPRQSCQDQIKIVFRTQWPMRIERAPGRLAEPAVKVSDEVGHVSVGRFARAYPA